MYNTVGGSSRRPIRVRRRDYLHVLADFGADAAAGDRSSFAMQMSGTGTVHPTAGDTYTVTYTAGGTPRTI